MVYNGLRYTYMYVYLSVCALFWWKYIAENLLSFFKNKLMEFSFKNWNLRILE